MPDRKTGAVAGRPVPINDAISFFGYVAHLIWELNHEYLLRDAERGSLSRVSGNLYAVRSKAVGELPGNMINEDTLVGWAVRNNGYAIEYEPEAVVYLKSPDKLGDLINQRRRIAFGHMLQEKVLGGKIPSMDNKDTISMIARKGGFKLRNVPYTFASMAIEAWARAMAFLDFHFSAKQKHIQWKEIPSSKNWE